MKYGPDCVSLVKRSEGWRAAVYADAVGKATIGWGHLVKTGEDFSGGITEAQGEEILAADLDIAQAGVDAYVKVPLTQGQCDALVDFVFNMGAARLKGSQLVTLLNMEQYEAVPNELYHVDEQGKPHGWVFAGGKALPGLITRRQAEIALWEKA